MDQIRKGQPLAVAAARAGMSEKTARRYRGLGCLPGEAKRAHDWRTRVDPFDAVWPELEILLTGQPGLQATTLWAEMQRRYAAEFASGQFHQGQLRTLQRRVKRWRATAGPAKEVMFPQVHHPGRLAASDFCHLGGLGITIAGQRFPHLLYHFVLTYSNWETGSICFAESLESLSAGLQAALWELGGVPQRHRTDSLSAAVQPPQRRDDFTTGYQALLRHYQLTGEHTQPRQAHENGDVEQRHYRLRTTLEQALLLRGSRDFASRDDYTQFLRRHFAELNAPRRTRLQEERVLLAPLPARRLETGQQWQVRVGPSSTIRVKHKVYSVPSRLIGEWVQVRLGAEELEVWYGQQLVQRMDRLQGGPGHRIDYRHIIERLVRKPGAFANYRYQADLFPSSHFRIAYDALQQQHATRTDRTDRANRADKEYLLILQLAAQESEEQVQEALRFLLATEAPLSAAAVQALLHTPQSAAGRQARPGGHRSGEVGLTPGLPVAEVQVPPINLAQYDLLLTEAAGDEGRSEVAL